MVFISRLFGLTRFLLFDLDLSIFFGDVMILLLYFLPKVGIYSITLDSSLIGHIP